MERNAKRQRHSKNIFIEFDFQSLVYTLTCIGDSKAVGSLYVVNMRDQVKGSFCSIGAGVVKEDS